MTPFVAAVVVLLALFGAALAAVGSYGLLRLRSFYERAHPATLAATLGATSILLAALLFYSTSAGRLLPKALLLIVFIPLVNPVTTMLLARAALSRDRAKRRLTPVVTGSADEDWLREADELVRAQAEAAKQPAVREDDGGA
ncbi:MAG: monovalent cation/H(+) antiporter subunit G [Trueperaceae bacterium]|nr:monovalent cation/H(+) antiporter subunit G [Trueperaceae bacterium]MCC6310915.1 monovalent cation/H(+) antiporter subunit G [Trueperaceae bacterium]MCO5174602.1 monovalent cation/H(+) antiporter subunit G [Trueperaceae bacterium]MCW5819642.1 monovalent cation/H(+) antiporter subunit G [Trueperaceae bacterium]